MKRGTFPNVNLRRFPWLLGLLVMLAPAVASAEPEEASGAEELPLRVGVVLDEPDSRLAPLLTSLQAELNELSKGLRPVVLPANKRLAGAGTQASLRAPLQRLLSDPDVDLVLGFGALASQSLAQLAQLDKPAVAPFLLYGAHPKGPEREALSNFSPIAWKLDIERDFAALDELGIPGKVAWLGSREVLSLEGLAGELEKASRARGRPLALVPVERDVGAAISAIPEDVAIVYVGPNPQLKQEQLSQMATLLVERRLPSFSWLGEPMVERGFLSGLGSRDDLQRLVRRLALNLRAIAEGGTPSEQRRAFARDSRWTLNMATARALSLSLRWSLLLDARVLNPARKADAAPLDLAAAVRLSLKQNFDLAALEQEIQAGQWNVDLARAALLPRADAAVQGVWIDADRAGLGKAERMAQWSLEASVPLYSERAWANLTVQRELQHARQEQGKVGELDVAWATARAYLALHVAKASENVQRDQLRTTHEHLELAEVRVATGAANPAEVARWTSQIAAARRAVVAAVAQRNLSEMQLNQVLGRPLEEPLSTREAGLEDVDMLAAHLDFRAYLDSTGGFKRLRQFLVEEAAAAAPEIRALEHGIAAKERELRSNERAYYAPTVALFGGATHRFARDGEGSETPQLPLAGGQGLPMPNTFDWQFGVSVSLPLYEGGRRGAAVDKSRTQLSQMRAEKQSLLRRIDQRVRAALHQAGSSFAAIALARDAQRAAEKNLTITSEGYARGVVNIVQLLDAQTQALSTRLSAESAVYAYLLDGVEIERASGLLAASYSDALAAAMNRGSTIP
jgi:outer membrane protein TolC